MSTRSLCICLPLLIFIRCRPDDELAYARAPTSPQDEKTSDYTRGTPNDPEDLDERPQPPVPCTGALPNLVRNGDFELPPRDCGWRTIDLADWGIVAAQDCWLAEATGCVVYLETDVWGDPWIAQLIQDVQLDDRAYVLSFETMTEEPRSLSIAIRASAPSPEEVLLLETIELELGWHSYEFALEVEANARASVIFGFGEDDEGMYLDSVSLIPRDD
ncbi:hypothetical protein HY478_00615 [Candidatus Uhrbacteria bacterium]|nr:hypothetical protein [Candidatus Uhrbacteria bacterium]